MARKKREKSPRGVGKSPRKEKRGKSRDKDRKVKTKRDKASPRGNGKVTHRRHRPDEVELAENPRVAVKKQTKSSGISKKHDEAYHMVRNKYRQGAGVGLDRIIEVKDDLLDSLFVEEKVELITNPVPVVQDFLLASASGKNKAVHYLRDFIHELNAVPSEHWHFTASLFYRKHVAFKVQKRQESMWRAALALFEYDWGDRALNCKASATILELLLSEKITQMQPFVYAAVRNTYTQVTNEKNKYEYLRWMVKADNLEAVRVKEWSPYGSNLDDDELDLDWRNAARETKELKPLPPRSESQVGDGLIRFEVRVDRPTPFSTAATENNSRYRDDTGEEREIFTPRMVSHPEDDYEGDTMEDDLKEWEAEALVEPLADSAAADEPEPVSVETSNTESKAEQKEIARKMEALQKQEEVEAEKARAERVEEERQLKIREKEQYEEEQRMETLLKRSYEEMMITKSSVNRTKKTLAKAQGERSALLTKYKSEAKNLKVLLKEAGLITDGSKPRMSDLNPTLKFHYVEIGALKKKLAKFSKQIEMWEQEVAKEQHDFHEAESHFLVYLDDSKYEDLHDYEAQHGLQGTGSNAPSMSNSPSNSAYNSANEDEEEDGELARPPSFSREVSEVPSVIEDIEEEPAEFKDEEKQAAGLSLAPPNPRASSSLSQPEVAHESSFDDGDNVLPPLPSITSTGSIVSPLLSSGHEAKWESKENNSGVEPEADEKPAGDASASSTTRHSIGKFGSNDSHNERSRLLSEKEAARTEYKKISKELKQALRNAGYMDDGAKPKKSDLSDELKKVYKKMSKAKKKATEASDALAAYDEANPAGQAAEAGQMSLGTDTTQENDNVVGDDTGADANEEKEKQRKRKKKHRKNRGSHTPGDGALAVGQ